MDPGYRLGRQYGSFWRQFRLHDRNALLLLACEHIYGFLVLGRRNAVGEASVDSIDLFWTLLACGSVVAVNVTRIALTGLSQYHYQLIHNPLGDMVTDFIILGLTIGFSILGARRELFSRV